MADWQCDVCVCVPVDGLMQFFLGECVQVHVFVGVFVHVCFSDGSLHVERRHAGSSGSSSALFSA